MESGLGLQGRRAEAGIHPHAQECVSPTVRATPARAGQVTVRVRGVIAHVHGRASKMGSSPTGRVPTCRPAPPGSRHCAPTRVKQDSSPGRAVCWRGRYGCCRGGRARLGQARSPGRFRRPFPGCRPHPRPGGKDVIPGAELVRGGVEPVHLDRGIGQGMPRRRTSRVHAPVRAFFLRTMPARPERLSLIGAGQDDGSWFPASSVVTFATSAPGPAPPATREFGGVRSILIAVETGCDTFPTPSVARA